MTFSLRSVALGILTGLAAAAPAGAELVVLSSGRVISAASVVLTVDAATIRLRGGGEVTCDRSLVVRVDPDETPWIAPASEAQAADPVPAGASTATPAPVMAFAPVRDVVIPA